jgi:long-chain acyl-CoA synthetase
MSSLDSVNNPKNIFELFLNSAEKYSKKEALRYKVGHHYELLTFEDLKKEVIGLVSALKKIGFKKGDKAIIFSENRPEWVISDLAFAALGVINIPIHTVLSSSQLLNIINEINPKGLFFSGNSTVEKIAETIRNTKKIPYIFSFEDINYEEIGKIIYFKSLLDSKLTTNEEIAIISESHEIKPFDLLSIIYTSGSTGRPKGVKLSHANVIENIKALGITFRDDIVSSDRFFSVLPLSHIFERTTGYYVPFYFGSSIAYCLDLKNFSDEIKEIKPTIVLAVPRLYEKIFTQIQAKINKNFISKIMFRLAIYIKTSNRNKWLVEVFDKIIFDNIKKQLGGRIKFFVSGGAPLASHIAVFFEKLGFIILEGYGLTETSPVIACNRLRDYRFGTVGPVISGVELNFGKNGEIRVKGPSVFSGYINDEDNKSSFVDGWFRTGDLGHLDRGGYLVISGRKKEMIVLSTGKKVIPTVIEEALENSPYIEQAFVYGEGKKHICALIVPNFLELSKKFNKAEEELIGDKAVNLLIASEINNKMKDLASYEKVFKFEVLDNPFTIDNGELTPTLKLRRHVIYKRYSEIIESLY